MRVKIQRGTSGVTDRDGRVVVSRYWKCKIRIQFCARLPNYNVIIGAAGETRRHGVIFPDVGQI